MIDVTETGKEERKEVNEIGGMIEGLMKEIAQILPRIITITRIIRITTKYYRQQTQAIHQILVHR